MDSKLLSCREMHAKEYGTFPSVVASAPGKIGLLGDYTEFANGLSLSVATVQRVWVSVASRSDQMIRFFSREYNERKKAAVSNLKYRKEDRWANYPKGVLAAFAQHGVELGGLDVALCGDIPQGIGLASSQAVCLASALAFDAYFQTHLSTSELLHIAHRAETNFLGLKTGLSTLMVLTYAQPDHFYWYDARDQEGQSLPFPWPELELAVINSRVPSSSFDSSSRLAREECESCLRILNSGRSGKTLRDYNKNDLRERVGTIPEAARRRSLHVIEEISRAQEARELLINRDSAGLGRLMNRSHESLRDLFEVSCPEIDWLVKRLQDIEGLVGARMTGGATGGCVVAVGQEEGWGRFRVLSEEYERIFGFKAELTPFRPSGGARVDQKNVALG